LFWLSIHNNLSKTCNYNQTLKFRSSTNYGIQSHWEKGGIKMASPVYLDYNATTPLDPEVIEAMRPFFEEEFGNPSSKHWYGIAPKQAVEKARGQVAGLLNCSSEEILFTSGGTESNNHAIIGIARAYRNSGNHIITSQVEHPAVLEVCDFLAKEGFDISCLPVDRHGALHPQDVADAVTDKTLLITIMHANNEVGTIQPIRQISEIARQRGIVMHTDAAQSVGKIPTNVNELGVDLLSIAGHKVYAPKGVGALYVRHNIRLKKFIHGAGQEGGRRAGTENVMEIVGLGQACEIAERKADYLATHMLKMRKLLHENLEKALDHVRLNGHPENRLPNTLSISFKGLEANRILEEIGLEVAASAGAACHSDQVHVSHVLKAMGVQLEWAKGTLRFSTGKMTTEADIHTAAKAVIEAVKRLRG
jgi:cysteine desulfurase